MSLAHLADEITAFQKMVIWSGDLESEDKAQRSGQVFLWVLFLKLLAGKLKEGNELLRTKYYRTPVSKDYDQSLSSDAKEALDDIKRYFSQSNLIHVIRNFDAFHYSPDEVDAALPSVPEELELYFQTDGSANNLYYFAEVLANRALLRSIRLEDEKAAFQRFTEEIQRVTHWFTVVCDSLIAEFLRRRVDGIWQESATECSLKDVPTFKSVRIPWFVDIAGLSEESG